MRDREFGGDNAGPITEDYPDTEPANDKSSVEDKNS